MTLPYAATSGLIPVSLGSGTLYQAAGGDTPLPVALTLSLLNAVNNDISTVLTLDHETSGTPTGAVSGGPFGIGTRLSLTTENSAGTNIVAGTYSARLTTVTAGSEVGQLVFQTYGLSGITYGLYTVGLINILAGITIFTLGIGNGTTGNQPAVISGANAILSGNVAGSLLTLKGGNGNGTGDGGNISITGGLSGETGVSGSVFVAGADANTATGAAGGVAIIGGATAGAGIPGNVVIRPGFHVAGTPANVELQDADSNPIFGIASNASGYTARAQFVATTGLAANSTNNNAAGSVTFTDSTGDATLVINNNRAVAGGLCVANFVATTGLAATTAIRSVVVTPGVITITLTAACTGDGAVVAFWLLNDFV